MRSSTAFLTLVALIVTMAAWAGEPVRIDASSDKAANTSFAKMLRWCSRDKQKELSAALVQLNFAGMHSAYEVVNDPNKQSIDAAHVKDQIAGLDADQIIAYAARNRKPGDPKVEVK